MNPEQLNLIKDLREEFTDRFSAEPLLAMAPGRINLLGEHTDYNNGFALPAAIDKAAYFALALSDEPIAQFIALDLMESFSVDLEEELWPVPGSWINYFLGIMAQFQKKGIKLPGFHCIFKSTVPVGAGMSSSAAIESGFGTALNALLKADFTPSEIAFFGQRAEHEFAGVKCGIMDQFASCFGKENQVIELDCRDLSFKYHSADFENYEWILFDSQVKHDLASSAYNTRREQCEQGVTALRSINPAIESLRDAQLSELEDVRTLLEPNAYQRCLYVVEENMRVQQACTALDQQDAVTFGNLMFATHTGLSNLYEVSCAELDFLVEKASEHPAVIGARMMGGGFGGCTLNLVKKEEINALISYMEKAYQHQFYKWLKHYKVVISNGARVVEV